ncbi:MAG: hypothetical protein FWG10_12820 [Eubacteriaceae bacterium]|nr:hypothetical protein [Eubacteriaceae bacterium]
MRNMKKWISILIAFAMLATTLCPVLAHGEVESYDDTIGINSEAAGFGIEGTAYGIDEVGGHNDDSSGGEAGIAYEIEEMRDAQSKTFMLDDGQLQTVVYASPVHYLEEGEGGVELGQDGRGQQRGGGKRGRWRQIDNTIVPAEKSTERGRYSLKNNANFFSAHFGDTGEGKYAVLLEFGGNEFAFNPVTENGAKPKQMKGAGRRKAAPAEFAAAIPESDTVIYEKAYDGADLTYTVSENAVKEYIVINEHTGVSEFQFEICAPGAKLGYGGDGCPVFTYGGDASVSVAGFFAFDAKGAFTEEGQVRHTLEQQGGGQYLLTVTLDEGYITDPGGRSRSTSTRRS